MAATIDAVFGERDVTGGASGNFTWTGRNIAGSRLCAAFFLANGATATALTSLTSPNLMWTRRVQAVDAGNNNRVEIWTAWAAAGLTGEVLTSAGGGSYNRRSFVLTTVQGSESAGAGNTATDIDSSPADPELTLTDSAAGSLMLGGIVGRGSGDTTEDANTTQQYSSGSWAGFEFGERVWSRAGTGTTTKLASAGDDPLFWIMAGLEIKAATGGDETITLDKWNPAYRFQRGPRTLVVPSGMTPPTRVD